MQHWRVAEPGDVFDGLCSGTVRAAAMLHAQSATALDAIRAAVAAAVGRYPRGEGYEVPMPAVLAAAVKARKGVTGL